MATRVLPAPLTTPTLPQSKRVLLLVDFINPLDFPGSGELAPAAVPAARATAQLKARLTRQGVPTIYANDNYGLWQSDFHTMVASMLGRDGPSAQIAELLYPQAQDLTILKPRHSAFFASPLDLLLQEMGAEELVICGLATDMCVQATAADGFLRKYRMHVPADCTAAESIRGKNASLAYMERIFQCDITPALRRTRARAA